MIDLMLFQSADIATAWDHRPNRVPRELQALVHATHLVLAHATSTTLLGAIRREGLQPNAGRRMPTDEMVASDESSVYLMAVWDSFYAERAVRFHGGEAAILIVRVPIDRLEADEAMISPANRGTGTLVANLHVSLCGGACKHRGRVAPDCILGTFDRSGMRIAD